MNAGLITLATNLGISFEAIITLVMVFGGLIFYAVDFKIGTIIMFFISGSVFMWFYAAGYNYIYPLAIMLIMVVILAITLLFVNKTESKGGLVG